MIRLIGTRAVEAESWMQAAATVAKEALCLKAKCGTVIVQKDEIIGSGYNAPPLDIVSDRRCALPTPLGKAGYDYTCCVHAELRAIHDALRCEPQKLAGAQLYFTRVDDNNELLRSGQPFCTVCSRLALDVGIGEFLLWHEDGIYSYPTDQYNIRSYEYAP